MKIAIHVLAILSPLSVLTSEIASDSTDDDNYSFRVELKMVKEKNEKVLNYDVGYPRKFGAVLVSDSWILTRIMSFRCPNDYWGATTCAQSTLSNWEAIIGDQKRNITRKVLHPKHHNNANNDFTYGVVLARLDRAVVTSTCVQQVSLFQPGETSLEVGTELTIFWKQYEGNEEIIKKSNVYVTRCLYPDSGQFCASPSPTKELSLMMQQYYTIPSRTSLGGSPAVQYIGDQAYLVGIIMGSTAGKIDHTRVDTYIDFLGEKVEWIERVVKRNDD